MVVDVLCRPGASEDMKARRQRPGRRLARGELIGAFVTNRLLDILKPPPARQLESLPRGWGIVMDDVAAGAMALGLTVLCLVVAARVR